MPRILDYFWMFAFFVVLIVIVVSECGMWELPAGRGME